MSCSHFNRRLCRFQTSSSSCIVRPSDQRGNRKRLELTASQLQDIIVVILRDVAVTFPPPSISWSDRLLLLFNNSALLPLTSPRLWRSSRCEVITHSPALNLPHGYRIYLWSRGRRAGVEREASGRPSVKSITFWSIDVKLNFHAVHRSEEITESRLTDFVIFWLYFSILKKVKMKK